MCRSLHVAVSLSLTEEEKAQRLAEMARDAALHDERLRQRVEEGKRKEAELDARDQALGALGKVREGREGPGAAGVSEARARGVVQAGRQVECEVVPVSGGAEALGCGGDGPGLPPQAAGEDLHEGMGMHGGRGGRQQLACHLQAQVV